MSAWPDWLDERIDMIRALEEARGIEKHLDDNSPELEFTKQQIAELERELEKTREETEVFLNRLYTVNCVAASAARLRFLRGLMWKEIAYMTGKSEGSIKARVIRAFLALNEEGIEAGEDSAPPPG